MEKIVRESILRERESEETFAGCNSRQSELNEALSRFLRTPDPFLSTRRENRTNHYGHASRFCPILWKSLTRFLRKRELCRRIGLKFVEFCPSIVARWLWVVHCPWKAIMHCSQQTIPAQSPLHRDGDREIISLSSALKDVFLALVVFSPIVIGSCDKGVEVPPPKNPRDYMWKVDTLAAHPDALQTWMWDIYATSPENVYVVGHTDWTGVNGDGIMWRYDGVRWSIINQGFRDISLESITGFGPSNIYAAGNKGPDAVVLHFDGVRWTQTILPGRALYTIRGSGPSDIWAAGWGGTVFHFDGAQWAKIETDQRWNFKDLAIFEGKVYAIAYRLDEEPRDTVWHFSLSWSGSRWDTIQVWAEGPFQISSPTFGTQSLSIIGGEMYSAGTPFSYGAGLFQFISGDWVAAAGEVRVAKAFGSSKNSIFGGGSYGKVYHFNGTDWYQFDQFRSGDFRLVFWTGWTDGREAFILGNDAQRSYVLHGR